MRKNLFISLSMVVFFMVMASLAMTIDKVGEVNAVKGKAGIIRSDKKLTAKVLDSVLLTDTVETERSSRMKILFIDDSILNLGENSKVSIKEYVLGDEAKRGQSVFTLIDGRLRAVVGKNKLEIHTPTAVAAARGTILFLWMKNNSETCLALLRGTADLSNINKTVQGTESVKEGNMSCVAEGLPPSKQEPIPPDLLRELKESTDDGSEPDPDNPPPGPPGDEDGGLNLPSIPPIELEPGKQSPGGYGY